MNSILAKIVGAILQMLPSDLLLKSVGSFIDSIENHIKNDGVNNWEDTAILPLLEALKKQLGIVSVAPQVAQPAAGAQSTNPAA